MSDRHLYKGKREDNGEWVEGYVCRPHSRDDSGNVKSWYFNERDELGFCAECIVSDDTICQCTGLPDKNGKLIWENDIVDGHIKRGAAFCRCIVLWNEYKARFDVRAMGCNFPMTLDECTDDISISGLDYEVISNIFDNPELLEVEA